MSEQRQEILEGLQDVKFVGPSLAEQLYEEVSIRTIDDIVEAADKGWLRRLDGIGEAREQDILESARALKNNRDGTSDGGASNPNGTEATRTGDVSVKTVDRDAAGRTDTENRSAADVGVEESNAAAGAAGDEESGETDARSATDPSPDRPRPRIERFFDRLRCPACGHDSFDRTKTALSCTACRREYEIRNGTPDLASPNAGGQGLLQRLMESSIYSKFYENTARPWFTSVVSDRSIQDEIALAGDMLELDPDSVVLDVACGTGNFTRHFAEQIGVRTTGYDDKSLVVGIDLSWSMLERARGYLRRDGLNDRIFLVRGDATRMPIGRSNFNRLHCGAAVHFMDDIDEAFRNFARVLQPDGICVIGTFLARGNSLLRLAKRAGEIPTNMHWFERDELHERLERAGLAVVEDDVSDQSITVKTRRK